MYHYIQSYVYIYNMWLYIQPYMHTHMCHYIHMHIHTTCGSIYNHTHTMCHYIQSHILAYNMWVYIQSYIHTHNVWLYIHSFPHVSDLRACPEAEFPMYFIFRGNHFHLHVVLIRTG